MPGSWAYTRIYALGTPLAPAYAHAPTRHRTQVANRSQNASYSCPARPDRKPKGTLSQMDGVYLEVEGLAGMLEAPSR
jgi:hypothetical protein